MKDFKFIYLIILLFILSGCSTLIDSDEFVTVQSREWKMPEKALNYGVNFQIQENGLFLNFQSASNLMYNIDEMDAYIEKLEVLIEQMKIYYQAK